LEKVKVLSNFEPKVEAGSRLLQMEGCMGPGGSKESM
jgi:hypothetical protein